MIMFIKILFNFQGRPTLFQGERTQGECVVRANGPDTELERQIRCVPYGERSDGTRLQQVEQKADRRGISDLIKLMQNVNKSVYFWGFYANKGLLFHLLAWKTLI